MTLKIMPLLAGALAFSVTTAPMTVKAQSNQPKQPAPGQAQNQPKAGVIELSQQQRSQLAQIRRDTLAQIEQVFTPQQRQKLQSAIQSGQGPQAAIAAMNLSSEQQTRLRTIVQSARKREEAILTPQQRQQIQQYIQQRRQQPNQQGAQ